MTTWVLLRGWARESRHWGDFPASLRLHLPGGDEVLAVDLPGNGRFHRQTSPCSVAAMVQACRRRLEESGADAPYAVLGLSLGAMVALQWSYDHPDEIAAGVLVNGSFGGYSAIQQRLKPSAWLPLLSLLRRGASPLEQERKVLALTSSCAAPDEAVALRWAAYATDQPVSRTNAVRQLLAAARFRPPRQAPRVPLLVVASLQDRLVSPQGSSAFARQWGFPLRLHPGAGHDLALDAPDWLVEQVTVWWRHQRGVSYQA